MRRIWVLLAVLALASGVLANLPRGYQPVVDRILEQWSDAAGRQRLAADSLYAPYFIGEDLLLLGYGHSPYQQKGPRTGTLYYNYSHPLTLIFPPNHRGLVVQMAIWPLGGKALSVRLGENLVEILGETAVETVDNARFQQVQVFTPGRRVEISIPAGTRSYIIQVESGDLVLSDISVERREIPAVAQVPPAPSTPPPQAFVTYTNDLYNVAFTVPSAWERLPARGRGLVTYLAPDLVSSLALTAEKLPEGMSLNAYVEAIEKGMGITPLLSLTLSNLGAPGVMKDYLTTVDGQSLRLRIGYVVHQGVGYTLTGVTMADSFARWEPEITGMIYSFRVLSR